MADRFGQAMLTLENVYLQDLEDCNIKWTATLDADLTSTRQTVETSDRNNAHEIQNLRTTLNEQLPSKVKESYQLLNLRQMEHHMAKQKEYSTPYVASSRHISSKIRSATSTHRNSQPGTRKKPRQSSKQWQISKPNTQKIDNYSTSEHRYSSRTTTTPGTKKNSSSSNASTTTPKNSRPHMSVR